MKDRSKILQAAILFLACACFVFRHQIANGSAACVEQGDLTDWQSGVWILCWTTHALITNPISLLGGNILYPAQFALFLSEYGPGLQLFFAPAYLLTGDPNIAFTIFAILGCVASSLSAYFVAWRWFRRKTIATVAGLSYGFFLILGLDQPVYAAAWWWPLCIYYFDRALRKRSWKDAFKSALFIGLNGLSSLQLLVISLTFLSVTALYLIAAERRIPKNNVGKFKTSSVNTKRWMANPTIIAVVTMLLGIATTVPFYLPYVYLALSGVIGPRQWSFLTLASSDDLLSCFCLPGILAPLLFFCFFMAPKFRRTRLLNFIAINAFCGYILSKGPVLVVGGVPTYLPLPYCVFLVLPILNFIRAPYRFLFLAAFFFALLAGVGVYSILSWLGKKLKMGKTLEHPLIALIPTCLILLGLDRAIEPAFGRKVPSSAEMAPCYRWLASAPNSTIVAEYPNYRASEYSNYLYMYRACFHWHRIVNGDTSYLPASYESFAARDIISLPCPSSFDNLAALGVTHVFVHLKPLPPRLQNIFHECTNALHPITMGDELIVPLALLRQKVESQIESLNRSASVSIAKGDRLALPAATKVRLALPAQYSGAIWTNARPNFSETIHVAWKSRIEPEHTYQGTMECFLPPFLRSGVEDVATCILHTPKQPGEYELTCTTPPTGLKAFAIPIDLKGSSDVNLDASSSAPKAEISFAGSPEFTGASGPLRMPVRIRNTGKAPLVEQTQLNLDLVNLLRDLRAGTILRLGDAWYSACVTGNVAEVRPEWIDGNGKVCLVELNANACLPAPVYPGTTIEMPITLFAPPNPGKYKLRLHLELESRRKTCPVGGPRIQPIELATIEKDVTL